MRKFSIAIMCVLIITIAGCGTCWTFSGGYKDYQGGVTICPNGEKSNESNTIAVDVTKEKDGEKETLYALPETDIAEIVDKLKDKIGIKSIKSGPLMHPVKELQMLLKKGK